MQGKKTYQPKLFTTYNHLERIPEDNFYRRLKDVLDLGFLEKATKPYYGTCGQKSIDPTVFFRLTLVGYLENIVSDRKLVREASMRMDILYFLDYDIDEELPWDSTLSRSRALYPASVFASLFDKVLGMCVSKGLVLGKTQAVDSAPVKANASMENLEAREPAQPVGEYLDKLKVEAAGEAPEPEGGVPAGQKEPPVVRMPAKTRDWSKPLSNARHRSPSDPDARIYTKPGKPRKLCYLNQLSVDTHRQVITHAGACFADAKDSEAMPGVARETVGRLGGHGLAVENVLADANYSSGECYGTLERLGVKAYIPPHGGYKGGPDGFLYDHEGGFYACPQGKKAFFLRSGKADGRPVNIYRVGKGECAGCPLRASCMGKSKSKTKRFEVTAYRDGYERAIERVSSPKGRYYKAKRQSTVEPVFGTLAEHMGMRGVLAKGIDKANKCILMAAVAFNLKKYLKHGAKKPQNQSGRAGCGQAAPARASMRPPWALWRDCRGFWACVGFGPQKAPAWCQYLKSQNNINISIQI